MTAYEQLAHALNTDGAISHTDAAGRRIMLVSGRLLPFASAHDLLIAYEGEGSLLWDTRKKLNTFTLIQAGFGLSSGPTLVELCNGLISHEDTQQAQIGYGQHDT